MSTEQIFEPHILIDADACPVRDEVYKVAQRHQALVIVVSNSYLRVPAHAQIHQVIVDDKADAADDYIAQRANQCSVVITADILLAERCLKTGSIVLAPSGKPFTPETIGGALAMRELMVDLRAGAGSENIGGPAAFTTKDRSRFLQILHESLVQMARARPN